MSDSPSFEHKVERLVEESRRKKSGQAISRSLERELYYQEADDEKRLKQLIKEQGGGFLPEQIWGENSEEAMVSHEFLKFMVGRYSTLEVCVYSRNRFIPFEGTPPLRRKKGIFGHEIGFIDPQGTISSYYDRGLSRDSVYLCENGTVRTYGPDPEAIFTPVIGHYEASYIQHDEYNDGKNIQWMETVSTFVGESLSDRLASIAAKSSIK